jgi:hypothetical protein
LVIDGDTHLAPQLFSRTSSIANGLAFGITAYALLKLLRGRITRIDWLAASAVGAVRGALRVPVGGNCRRGGARRKGDGFRARVGDLPQ